MLDVGLLLESVWQSVEVEEFQFNSYVTSTFQMTNIHDSHIHSYSETQIIVATHSHLLHKEFALHISCVMT